MKIAFLCQDLVGEGAQYATALMVRGFIAKGYEVDLLLSQYHTERLAKGERPFAIPDAANVIMMPSSKARGNIRMLRYYLKTTDAEAVVAMAMNYESALAIASIGLWRRPKLYTVEHGIRFALDGAFGYAKKPCWWNRERLRRRLIYSRFDGILAVSAGVKRELKRMYGVKDAKIATVYNAVIDTEFYEKLARPTTHPWLVNKDVPTIVSAGTLSQAKDHLTLIKAVEELNRARHVRVVIFGEGSYRERYETYIKEHHLEDCVSLPGFSMSLPAEVKAADGYVSSSVLESFGIAITEALACGVPVIATDCPCGPREILLDGQYGELVSFGDVAAMKASIEKLLDGKVISATEESWKRFTREAIVGLYEKAIFDTTLWLEPYTFDNFQFFKQWVTEAWSNRAGHIKTEPWLPWRLKFFFDKIGLAFALLWSRNKRRLIITSGGNPGYLAVPHCYRYDLIPIVWDCWEPHWGKLLRFIKRNRTKLIFCTQSQVAAMVTERCPGTRAVWLPEGIKSSLYPMGPKLRERSGGVMKFGRDAGGKRLYPTHADLTAAMRDSKIVICRPRCDTNPEMAGCVETMTQRYWEAMLSGAIVVGRAPAELIRFCGYNPVVEAKSDAEIEEVLANFERYQDLVDRNRAFAERHADWSNRMAIIEEAIKEVYHA